MARSLGPAILLSLAASAACSGGTDGIPPTDQREHSARFVGLWLVDQPLHALYESTFYQLAADGTVTVGPSEPADCSGHLERHCVTGSVARCVPQFPEAGCQADLSCVFGDAWWSEGDDTLVFLGDCSDGAPRAIALAMAADPSANATGATPGVLTVGGEPGWSHDNWQWSFRKCAAGTDPATCAP